MLPILTFEELEAHTATIDWRSTEHEIVEEIAPWLEPAANLHIVKRGESLFIWWRGKEHQIPLTYTRHDRYVMLSSLAEILKGEYQFSLLSARLGDDTHSVLVLKQDSFEELKRTNPEWVNDNLTKLIQGTDHFTGLQIPYIDNENNNPKFKWQAKKLRIKQQLIENVLRFLFYLFTWGKR